MTESHPSEIQHDAALPGAAHPPVVRPRSLGARLRVAREDAGMTLADVALRTRVPERMLGAIEADAYDALPHSTFTNGFVRSFAREVGLPEAEASSQFRAENTYTPAAPHTAPLRPIEFERVPSSRLALVGILAAVGIAATAGLYYATRDRDVSAPTAVAQSSEVARVALPSTSITTPLTTSTTPPPPPIVASAIPSSVSSIAAQPAPALALPPTASSAAPAAPPAIIPLPAGPNNVVLTATQDAWIQVRDSTTKQRVMSGVLAQGKSYVVPPGDMTLSTGRAGALQVRIGGRLLAPLGGPVDKLRNVSLAAASLAARPATTTGTPTG